MFDKDGDGHISVLEVQDSMKSLGFHIELARVKLMVKHVDTDGMPRITTVFSLLSLIPGRWVWVTTPILSRKLYGHLGSL